jgi:hypothetical protein
LQLKCAYLVLAKVPLLEEAIFNRNKVTAERRRATCKVQHKECQIAKRDRNDNFIKRRKAGERGVSSNEDSHRSRRRAATYPARQWTRATCRGHPRRCLPAPSKCHHHSGRGRPRATGMWARARDKQLALPKRTSGGPPSHGAQQDERLRVAERRALPS